MPSMYGDFRVTSPQKAAPQDGSAATIDGLLVIQPEDRLCQNAPSA